MRWNSWRIAADGDKRVSSWYALLPVRIGVEVRWLERVSVEWEYRYYTTGLNPRLRWEKVRFTEQTSAATSAPET